MCIASRTAVVKTVSGSARRLMHVPASSQDIERRRIVPHARVPASGRPEGGPVSTTRFGTVLGLVIGGVWSFTGFDGALITAALAAVGCLVALVVEGRVDVTDYLGHRHDK